MPGLTSEDGWPGSMVPSRNRASWGRGPSLKEVWQGNLSWLDFPDSHLVWIPVLLYFGASSVGNDRYPTSLLAEGSSAIICAVARVVV